MLVYLYSVAVRISPASSALDDKKSSLFFSFENKDNLHPENKNHPCRRSLSDCYVCNLCRHACSVSLYDTCNPEEGIGNGPFSKS